MNTLRLKNNMLSGYMWQILGSPATWKYDRVEKTSLVEAIVLVATSSSEICQHIPVLVMLTSIFERSKVPHGSRARVVHWHLKELHILIRIPLNLINPRILANTQILKYQDFRGNTFPRQPGLYLHIEICECFKYYEVCERYVQLFLPQGTYRAPFPLEGQWPSPSKLP